MESLAKGRLKDTVFPFAGKPLTEKPVDVIVFIIGGATFSEAHTVAQFNKANQGMRVILGGNTIINSQQYVE